MSPEPSYDRLREGLQHAADVPVDVERSLEVVLGRRQQRVRARRTGAVLAAAAAVVVALAVVEVTCGCLQKTFLQAYLANAPFVRATCPPTEVGCT